MSSLSVCTIFSNDLGGSEDADILACLVVFIALSQKARNRRTGTVNGFRLQFGLLGLSSDLKKTMKNCSAVFPGPPLGWGSRAF